MIGFNRRMAGLGAAALAGLVALIGCGEGTVTDVLVPIVVDNGPQFIAAQNAMIEVGCGAAGCHAMIVGNFKVTPNPEDNPKDAVTLDDEYSLTRPFLDLDNPDESVLLTAALVGNVGRHVPCFVDREGCAWQIVTAWIAGEAADAVGCTPKANACFSGGE